MTPQEIKTYLSKPHRESPMGGHFFGVYSECPWKFFLRYVLGFQPTESQRYFIRGQAIHSGIELCIDDGFDPATGLSTAVGYVDLHADELGVDYEDDRKLVSAMMMEWTNEYATGGAKPDSARYTELGREVEGVLRLSNGYEISIRFDRVVRCRQTGRILIIDTKTTSRSISSPFRSLTQGVQAISYLLAGTQLYGEAPLGFIADVIVGKHLKAGPSVLVQRSPLITFSKYAGIQYELNMIGLLSEITQKVKTYQSGELPCEMLFPRSTALCSMWNCPFENICRRRPDPAVVPLGFTHDPRLSLEVLS